MRTYTDYVAECNQHKNPPCTESDWSYRNQYAEYLEDPGLMPEGYDYDEFVAAHKRMCSYFDKHGSN